MNTTEYTTIETIKERIDELQTELTFLVRPETLKYPITEISRREPWFDYNDYADEIITLLSGSLDTELQGLIVQFNDIIVSNL